MRLDLLIDALRRPAAYPWLGAPEPEADPEWQAEVIQTHISVVFLVDRDVIKIHKPVDLGFLDFTTLAARKRDCEAEVEVNAELAPGIYRGVAAIVRRGDQVVVERELDQLDDLDASDAELVEWAVWMRRLPESATFQQLLERRALARPQLWSLAATLASFYRDGAERAAAHPELTRYGDLETVSENLRENFAQLDAIIDEARSAGRPEPIDRDLITRLRNASENELAKLRELIRARFQAGKIRDTHGDLRLDHVYHLGCIRPGYPDRGRPGYPSRGRPADAELVDAELLDAIGRRELLIVDRIEFNDRFRWADPIADVAFLIMDLQARGAWQLARCFADDFINASQDREGEALLPFYTGYRATVRAKVAAIAAAELERGPEACAQARAKAEARARLALVELSRPRERPCMVLVAGLPGTGKSVLARALRETGGFVWIRSDEVRKRLAGLDPLADHHGEIGEGLYTKAWSDRTYTACLERAAEICTAGGRALVDASFTDGERREAFVSAAIAWGVPVHLLVVSAPPEIVHERLRAREKAPQRDPSDATVAVYEAARTRWSPVDPTLCRFNQIDASGSPREMLAEANQALARAGLG